jgi:hypothetical protein
MNGLKFTLTKYSSCRSTQTSCSKYCQFNHKRRYEVEFSKPHATKPIPEGTVKVFFNIIQLQNENGDDNGYEVEFNFENESLKHKLNNTMRKNMFEVSNLFLVLIKLSNG